MPISPASSTEQVWDGAHYLVGVPDEVSNVSHRIGLLVIREEGVVAANGGSRAVLILNVI